MLMALLWLCLGAAATTLIRPLAWEPPYAAGVALEKEKKNLFSITTLLMKYSSIF